MFRISSVFGVCVSVCLLFLVGIAHAQDDVKDVVLKTDATAMRAALADLNAKFGPGWLYQRDSKTGYARHLRGGRANMGLAQGEPIAAAKAFLDANRVLFGRTRKIDTFKYFQTRSLLEGTAIEFQQQYKGIPVWDGAVTFALNTDGTVRSASSSTWPIGNVDIKPQVSAKRALELVSQVHDRKRVEPMLKTELVVLARKQGVLAWRLRVHVSPRKMPWEHLVDATTGEVLESFSMTMDQQAPKPPEKKERRSQGPLPPQVPFGPPGPPPDPCDREWQIESPSPADVVVTSILTPEYTYFVTIDVGETSVGAAQDDTQYEAIYGAGMTLLPGIEYRIEVDWLASTWDSYNTDVTGNGGHWDVFFTTANSTGFFWDVTDGSPIAECSCTENFVEASPVGSGQLWTFGGTAWGDDVLCNDLNSRIFTYEETDLTKTVYFSVGLDTGRTGDVDGLYPSWGRFMVTITADTPYFNPNPVCTLNNSPVLADNNDSIALIPINGYVIREAPLPRLTAPASLAPYTLTGDFCTIAELAAPVIDEPRSLEGRFPYLRDCDGFEAVNCYLHITEYQEYLQSLGFTGTNAINNRSIQVDPHGIGNDDNAYYQPDGSGTGHLAFGDGGVDDGEDADVVVHEYAHACFDNAHVGVFGSTTSGSETRSINEGSADFLAASYFADESVASGFNPAVWAEWDAQSATGLRRTDLDLKYPADMSGSHHAQGQIFSRALWDLRAAVGGDRMVKCLFETVKLVNTPPKFVDMAQQMLVTPVDGTIDIEEIQTAFLDRGIFRALEVDAINGAGVPLFVDIEASEADLNGVFIDATPFGLVYPFDQALTLTAPVQFGGEPLLGWSLNGGAIVAGSDAGEVTITLDQNAIPVGGFLATAMYLGGLEGDFNNDGSIDGADLGLLIALFGASADDNPQYDLNGDGEISGGDLGILLANWNL
jgi:hypothetical protein